VTTTNGVTALAVDVAERVKLIRDAENKLRTMLLNTEPSFASIAESTIAAAQEFMTPEILKRVTEAPEKAKKTKKADLRERLLSYANSWVSWSNGYLDALSQLRDLAVQARIDSRVALTI